MPIVRVPLTAKAYDVQIECGLVDHTGEAAAALVKPNRCAIVTDSNVAPLYAGRVLASLKSAGFEPAVVTVPAGETSKSLTETARVCDALIDAGLDRSSVLFALGGGVVGDLAGFVAAIYFRGIPCIQIPTTVVAQVDSSVGGKTGVNALGGKNLLGAFHQPRAVLADPDTLRSLPAREFNEGFAEIIKHAAIREPDLLQYRDDPVELVRRNVAIKAAIVAEDEFETRGVRALLNFGHTIGHGIENAAGYGEILHGEAISLGLIAASRLSVEKAGLAQVHADSILRDLIACELPTRLPDHISTDAIVAALRRDKKFAQGAIRFVLLRAPGDAFVSEEITESDIRTAIDGLRTGPVTTGSARGL
ncbi:MAG: 3-dehydroquinate synthase [Terrimicrobiaceae bacterium]|nr:3-dehydroquinate synthase [Terrimicrobiaceae bacterium]